MTMALPFKKNENYLTKLQQNLKIFTSFIVVMESGNTLVTDMMKSPMSYVERVDLLKA